MLIDLWLFLSEICHDLRHKDKTFSTISKKRTQHDHCDRFQDSKPVGCLQKGMEVLRQAVGQRACVLFSAEYSTDWQSYS